MIENCRELSYDIIDPGVNANGRVLTRIGKENDFILVNNLCTPENCWKSKLTFRRKANWISEIDLCLISRSLIDAITSFHVDQCLQMPSDHAPISIRFDFKKLRSISRVV